jgi:hypothetical protein
MARIKLETSVDGRKITVPRPAEHSSPGDRAWSYPQTSGFPASVIAES